MFTFRGVVACKANGTCLPGGRAVPTARGKRVDTNGFYPLNSHFLLFLNLTHTRDRRPLRKRERQSGYSCVYFVKYSQFSDNVLLHMRATLRRRNTRGIAQRARESPLGDTCVAQFVGLVATDGTCEFNLIMNVYRRVRQGELPEGQEKVPWGTTSAHRAIRLALNKNEKMENALPRGSFSIPTC